MLNYLTINTVIELICCFIAIYSLSKDPSLFWKGMILYLLLITLGEFTGIYFKLLYKTNPKIYHSNAWVYNISLLIQISGVCFFFREVIFKEKNLKQIVLILVLIIYLVYAIEISKQDFYIYNDKTKTTLSIIVVLLCLVYYYLLINNEVYINLSISPEFWWVTGCLFFYFGSTVCNLAYPHIVNIPILTGRSLSYYIFNVLNIILYSFWSYSFLCRKWQSKNLKT